MGVYDHDESKYNLIGTSKVFPKVTKKRPTPVIFRDGTNNKKLKQDDDSNNDIKKDNTDKSKLTIQQQRESLPVYLHRKR